MNEALFNLGFDEVGKTFGKKLLISRGKKKQNKNKFISQEQSWGRLVL